MDAYSRFLLAEIKELMTRAEVVGDGITAPKRKRQLDETLKRTLTEFRDSFADMDEEAKNWADWHRGWLQAALDDGSLYLVRN